MLVRMLDVIENKISELNAFYAISLFVSKQQDT